MKNHYLHIFDGFKIVQDVDPFARTKKVVCKSNDKRSQQLITLKWHHFRWFLFWLAISHTLRMSGIDRSNRVCLHDVCRQLFRSSVVRTKMKWDKFSGSDENATETEESSIFKNIDE